jgi:hypothetical protein
MIFRCRTIPFQSLAACGERQERLWTPTATLTVGASDPFYQRMNQILDEQKFDEYVENLCQRFRNQVER